MSQDETRSQQVIEAYKRHKLALGALRRMQCIVRGFESDRQADRQFARIGIGLILLLLLVALALFLGGERVTLS